MQVPLLDPRARMEATRGEVGLAVQDVLDTCQLINCPGNPAGPECAANSALAKPAYPELKEDARDSDVGTTRGSYA